MVKVESLECRGAYTDKPLKQSIPITIHSNLVGGVKVVCPYLITNGDEFSCGVPHQNEDVVKDGIRPLERCYHKYPK